MEKSSIKLVSNIMIKSRFEKNMYDYLPFDMLPPEYSDKRSVGFLSKNQKQQALKRMFVAKKIIDDNFDE